MTNYVVKVFKQGSSIGMTIPVDIAEWNKISVGDHLVVNGYQSGGRFTVEKIFKEEKKELEE